MGNLERNRPMSTRQGRVVNENDEAASLVMKQLRLVIASSSEASEANVVICCVADSAISLAAVPACETAACPRSTASPIVSFRDSMVLRAEYPQRVRRMSGFGRT
jgi:hypothetical protein